MNTQESYAKTVTGHAKKKLKPSEFSAVMKEVNSKKYKDSFAYTDSLRGAIGKVNPKMVGAIFDNDYKPRKEVVKGPYFKGGKK